MAIAYITIFVVVLQVVSSAHVSSSVAPTEKPQETTTDNLTTVSTFDPFETTPETQSPSENFTISELTETTTDSTTNATSSTTTEADFELSTFTYVTFTDETTTELAPTTPSPTKNMAVVLSQPGLLSLLPVAVGLISQLRWCR
ncbi:hypothetical protein JTE90_028511 [Oedothorax gibbosus]|uniref:Uncharacterized protein n=1 Tax=Oedothorax gibbosus TaxID=931172 RepID=A0AAV6VUI0_9ARAC|nr:hypothetical protein JTE90_028511 [Oedothorax gibbosus]